MIYGNTMQQKRITATIEAEAKQVYIKEFL
jgi:hypothetical protein